MTATAFADWERVVGKYSVLRTAARLQLIVRRIAQQADIEYSPRGLGGGWIKVMVMVAEINGGNGGR